MTPERCDECGRFTSRVHDVHGPVREDGPQHGACQECRPDLFADDNRPGDPYGGHGKPEPLPQAVTNFLAERGQFITALTNCPADNLADYHRWQGHAEARRQLAEQIERAGQ